jgi:hypothetical protein
MLYRLINNEFSPIMKIMEFLGNKYIVAIGGILTPFVSIITNYLNDMFWLVCALIIMIITDTILGMYIAIKEKRFTSGENGFWKVGDKLFCYFGLIILSYTIVFLLHAVDLFNIGITNEASRFLIIFVFSMMYGREIISIFESIDKLQPRLLTKWFKSKIADIFNKKIEKE